jgi:hypothetical protein
VACCPPKDYDKIQLEPFEKAVSALHDSKDELLKYQKEYNFSGLDNFILQLSREQFLNIATKEKDEELNVIISMWDEKILIDSQKCLWFLKNGNVYFQIDECHNSKDFVVFDGGEEIMIDVQSDIRKYRIRPNWIYMRMMK